MVQSTDILAADFTTEPWWNNGLTTPVIPAEPEDTLDVAVIGAGYTGLSAALAAARGGRQVTVFEASTVGGLGCSARNGGQAASGLRHGLAALTRRFGPEGAQRIIASAHDSLSHLETFIRDEGIDCDHSATGHFLAAHKPSKSAALSAWAEDQIRFGHDAALVSPEEQRSAYVGSPQYHGGVVVRNWTALHPGKLLDGLVARAQEAGVRIVENTRVEDLRDSAGGMEMRVAGRRITARDVVVATNGYTSRTTPWLRRRIIPLKTFIIVTEELDPALVKTLFPGDAMAFDTRKLLSYFRATPDGKRVLFGTRVTYDAAHPERSVPAAYANLIRDFPMLRGVKIAHGWGGTVGFTFDELPHLGQRGAMHYAMGYCGRGVAMANYMGHHIGRRLAGDTAMNGFEIAPMKTMPFYTGRPWFLRPLMAAYGLRDKL